MKPPENRRNFLHTSLSALVAWGTTRIDRAKAGEKNQPPTRNSRPIIHRLGTVDFGVSETTPVVFRNRLYRFEYINRKYHRSSVPDDYFRLIDLQSGKITSPLALGHHLGSAFAEGDTMYAFGLPGGWGVDSIDAFWSKDLDKWSTGKALHLKGWRLYNNSVCRGREGYVMAIEAGDRKQVPGASYTCFFASSPDLRTWTFLGEDVSFGPDRFVGCPSIRYHDGHYYVFYLDRARIAAGPDQGKLGYDTHLVRSRDLKQWEPSPLNPVLTYSEQDRKIRNPEINLAQQQRIAKSPVLNVSDMDLCEFEDQVIFYYSWGSQRGIEYLAEARYDGTLGSFLQAHYPGR